MVDNVKNMVRNTIRLCQAVNSLKKGECVVIEVFMSVSKTFGMQVARVYFQGEKTSIWHTHPTIAPQLCIEYMIDAVTSNNNIMPVEGYSQLLTSVNLELLEEMNLAIVQDFQDKGFSLSRVSITRGKTKNFIMVMIK